ncbi:MAG: hypothetical protein IPH27_11740 [Actinomycetales bacterium]|nr:hypothetical protein [Candidatus Phosphoribacter baldrii]
MCGLLAVAGTPVPLFAQRVDASASFGERCGIRLQRSDHGPQSGAEVGAAGGDDRSFGASRLEGGAAPGPGQPPPAAALSGHGRVIDLSCDEGQLAGDPVAAGRVAIGPRQQCIASGHPMILRPITASRSSTSP